MYLRLPQQYCCQRFLALYQDPVGVIPLCRFEESGLMDGIPPWRIGEESCSMNVQCDPMEH